MGFRHENADLLYGSAVHLAQSALSLPKHLSLEDTQSRLMDCSQRLYQQLLLRVILCWILRLACWCRCWFTDGRNYLWLLNFDYQQFVWCHGLFRLVLVHHQVGTFRLLIQFGASRTNGTVVVANAINIFDVRQQFYTLIIPGALTIFYSIRSEDLVGSKRFFPILSKFLVLFKVNAHSGKCRKLI